MQQLYLGEHVKVRQEQVEGLDSGGWNKIATTLTYSSSDTPTFVIGTSEDLTSKISVGMRLKIIQSTTKYFIVTKITSSAITVFGGTDYTLINAPITEAYISSVKSPYGFPMEKEKWRDRVSRTFVVPLPPNFVYIIRSNGNKDGPYPLKIVRDNGDTIEVSKNKINII